MPRITAERRREKREALEESIKELRKKLYAREANLRKDERQERAAKLIALGAVVEGVLGLDTTAETLREHLTVGKDAIERGVGRLEAAE